MKMNPSQLEARAGVRSLSRRAFGLSLAALALSPRAIAQGRKPVLPVRSINHFGLSVSDVGRSVDWYQRVFGLPVQFTQDGAEGKVAILGLRTAPQFIALYPANGAKPAIRQMGLGLANFNRKSLATALDTHGTKAEWRTRKAQGGDVDELIVRDPDGLVIQVQDERHCGGGGALGDRCPQPWRMAPAGKPPVPVRMWNHLSYAVTDAERAIKFYQDVFGLRIKVTDYRQQQAIKILGFESGPQTVNPYFSKGAPLSGHICFGVEGFEWDVVAKQLADHGITVPPAAATRTGCCNSGIEYNPKETMMIRDPDGLMVQLVHWSFCAGTGRFGEVCGA
jgi:catechol 2,3-dioxygenase-like lactoylglutathione lyase family enzyme